MALQLNVKLEKSEGIDYIFKDLPEVYFPVMWFESTVDLPDSMAGALKLLINVPTIMVLMSVVGIIAGMIGIGRVWHCAQRHETDFQTKEDLEWKENMLARKLNFIKNLIYFRK